MLGNTSVAGDFVKTEQAPVSASTHTAKPSTMPIHTKLTPKKSSTSTHQRVVNNDVHDIATQAIHMAEKQAETSRSTTTIHQKKIVIQSGGTPPDTATWNDLSAIAAKSIQIAEDQNEHGNTQATTHQAELQRMMEQHFRQ